MASKKNAFSSECLEVLRLLKTRKNVLISGSPGTGKSRLLSEVAQAFMALPIIEIAATTPIHNPSAAVPIPIAPPSVDMELEHLQSVWPAGNRRDRKLFRTTFHQNSKNRDFITGILPQIDAGGGFRIVKGTLYRASEHAKGTEGAALLIIDEINRGPAVQVFGGSIVAIEPDKRLAEDNSVSLKTQFFEILDPNTGDIIEYALPDHLYIVAAMNQADASVEPLDVAFLRRWASFQLVPNSSVLREHFLLGTVSESLVDELTNVNQVYEAAVRAWEAINKRIRIGRSPEFELGHGIFLTARENPPGDIRGALEEMVEVWSYIRSHVEEVFFGDLRGIAATLNVRIGGSNNHSHPFILREIMFADEPRLELSRPKIDANNIYILLCAIIE